MCPVIEAHAELEALGRKPPRESLPAALERIRAELERLEREHAAPFQCAFSSSAIAAPAWAMSAQYTGMVDTYMGIEYSPRVKQPRSEYTRGYHRLPA